MKKLFLLGFVASLADCVAAPPPAATPPAPTITVQTGRPGADINPAMWGIFFEDINFGADGGYVCREHFSYPCI